MHRSHRNFFIDLMGKVGVPIFAATTVGCILSEKMEITHGVLFVVGLILTYLGHRLEHHGAAPTGNPPQSA